jgi:iron complex transport system substrate-binding protein
MNMKSVVAAQPDVYVLFESGLKSIGGVDGLLKVPGLA